jgi:hypothetical protein
VSELDVDRHRVSDRDARVVGSALDCQTFVAQVVQSSVFLLCDNNTGAGSGPGPVFLANRDFTSIREVGTAAYLARSGHADRVWASTITDGPDRVTTSLAELDLDGDVRSRFQADSYVTPAKEGFIHEDGKDLVLTDRVGSVTRRILSADVVDVQGDILVYDREVDDNIPCGDCGLHVYDMARHTDRRFGGLAVGALGRLSESGGVLIAASDEGMAVCSITSLMCAPVPGAGAGGYYGLTGTFASDEQWFFFVDPDRVSIDALDLRSGRVFRAFSGIDDSDRLPARSLPGTEISGLGSF